MKIEKLDKNYFRTFGEKDRAELLADKINEIIDHLNQTEEKENFVEYQPHLCPKCPRENGALVYHKGSCPIHDVTPQEKCLQEILGKNAVIDREKGQSHYHCWHQTPPACGIPLEKHTQCCLCDTVAPQEVGDWKEAMRNEYWFKVINQYGSMFGDEAVKSVTTLLAKKKAEVWAKVQELPIDLTASEMHKRVINIINETL
jgi:hypothetical protein